MPPTDQAMASDRNQKTINLSDKAIEEYELVASWLGMPLGTLLRQVLEAHHQSSTFANLIRRAKSEPSPNDINS